jgi:hypothetical protein
MGEIRFKPLLLMSIEVPDPSMSPMHVRWTVGLFSFPLFSMDQNLTLAIGRQCMSDGKKLFPAIGE